MPVLPDGKRSDWKTPVSLALSNRLPFRGSNLVGRDA